MTDLRETLLSWFESEGRDLPWRHRRDAYSIWVSEIMLQQTRVDTVIPYYHRFLERFPTVGDLAQADPEHVRAAWSGLGYYRRAKLMMDAARIVHDELGGEFPDSVQGLRELPGFGPYTAGAVASIAFDRPAPAVDGNTSRVLSRIFGIEGDVTKAPALREVWARADALAPGRAPGLFTQALMELGALICTPKNARCLLCPVRDSCAAHREGRVDEIPPPRKRPAKKRIDLTAIFAHDARGVILERRPEGGLLGGLWSLPLLDGHASAESLAPYAAKSWSWKVEAETELGEIRHVLTHRNVHMRIVAAKTLGRLPKKLRRVRLDQLGEIGIPSVTAKALRHALPDAELPVVGRKRG